MASTLSRNSQKKRRRRAQGLCADCGAKSATYRCGLCQSKASKQQAERRARRNGDYHGEMAKHYDREIERLEQESSDLR